MDGRFGKKLIAAGIILAFSVSTVIAGNTYMNDFPNVEVTEPDCYSFDIVVSQGSGTSATLSLRVNDVDEEAGELDEVYLNGVYLGYLSGTDGTWSTTSFNITNQIIYGSSNTIRVCIDPAGGESTDWKAELDWGQILVDGGSAEDADITSVSASGPWNAIQVQTNISATNTDTYRLEINLLDSTNNNKDIATDTFPLSGGSSTSRSNTVALPSEPSGSETFTVEALLFNNTTGIQQSVKTTTWTYSSEPPTDISLSDDHIDENLPALSLVGILSAVDADSGSHQFSIIGGDIVVFTVSGNELRSAFSFDHETRESYSLHIEAEDGDENTYSEWFTITIDDVNEAPTANDDAASVVEANTVIVTVLTNDEDPDDDDLSVSAVSAPSQGTAIIQPDNGILYVTNQGACGIDSFTYTIEDGNGESDSASVIVTIQNVAPTAGDDTVETQEDASILIDVLANDSDPGSGSLSILSVGSPSYGTTLIVGNSVRYTPQPRYEGSDRFSYVMQDNCGATATGWVDVRVLHTNHPPTAHAGSFYQGIVGEPLILDASFSNDPDLGDALQYRWDLDGDGTADTEWGREPRHTAIYTGPYAGQITVEVRDLYRGQPTGDSSQATALIRIAAVQSIQVFVFEDLNGDGAMDQGELGLPGVGLIVAGTEVVTEADGGISAELDTGSWSIAMSASAISQLTNRGFAIPETEKTVDLETGTVETVLLGVSKTSTKMKGFVYADLNENEAYDENIDQLLQGLRVILDEQSETLTDDAGRFFFLSVPFGEHMLWIGENVKPAESLSEDTILSLSIPITLERSLRAEFPLLWPWAPVGSDQGFLQINVEKSEEN